MFAKGSVSWWLPPLVAGMVAIAAGIALSWATLRVAGLLVLLAGLFLLNFFRDPEREPGTGLVSAADGRVILVDEVDDPELGRSMRIAVFMSPLDVHVNRAPTAGRVASIRHKPGGYLPAFRKGSERNERAEVLWETEWGRMKTIQIAGTLARRIVPYVEAGAALEKADRFGLIRLGSRVDHLLPLTLKPRVAVGDRTRAGETTIADERHAPGSLGREPVSPKAQAPTKTLK